MSFTLGAWTESIDTGAGGDTLLALVDQSLTTDTDDIFVPEMYRQLAAVYGLGVDLTRLQMQAPSLRGSHQLSVAKFDVVAAPPEPNSNPQLEHFFRRPIELEPSEGLRAFVINDGGAASRADVAAWFAGEIRPLPEGRIDTVRMTGTTTLTANAWSLVPLTPDQQIKAGSYEWCGMRGEAAGAVLARMVFADWKWRPGVIAFDDNDDVEPEIFRKGRLDRGWGPFGNRFIPQGEFFSRSADTAETVFGDIIRTGGPA